jgi:hypothetical protein
MINRTSSGRLGLITMACAGLLLSGCARLGAMSRTDPASIAVYPGGVRTSGEPSSPEARISMAHGCGLVRGPYDFSVGAIDLDCFRFPEDWPDDEQRWPAEEEATGRIVDTVTARVVNEVNRSAANAPVRSEASMRPLLAYARAAVDEVARNRLTAILLKHSDDICTIEMGRITSNQAAVNASFNIVATAATTVANIVTGTQAQEILTGIGTFAGASRSHINADVYRNTFAYALSRAITLERQKQREAIERRYVDKVETFTVDDAIRAANVYHSQCSFYKGLELLLASVENGATLDRSLRERERQLQIMSLEEEIARLNRDIGSRPRTDTSAAELFRRLDQATAARSTLVLTPVSTSPPTVTPPTVPPQPTNGGT